MSIVKSLYIIFLFLPGIFFIDHKKPFLHNIIMMFSITFIFQYITGIVYLLLEISTIFLYISFLYVSVILAHIFNRSIFVFYNELWNKAKMIFKNLREKEFRDFNFNIREQFRKFFFHFSLRKVTAIVCIFFLIMVFYHSVFFPVTSADAIVTHMPLIKFLYYANSFPNISELPFINKHFCFDLAPFHIIGSLLYRITVSDFLIRFVNPILLMISICALNQLLINLNINTSIRYLTLIFFTSSPALLSVSSTMSNDIPAVAFFILALYFSSLAIDNKISIKYIFLADLNIGLMLASKQTAFINYIFFLCFRLIIAFNVRRSKRDLLIFFSYFSSLLFGSTKYLVSYVNFKDPFYPYTYSLISDISKNKYPFLYLFISLFLFTTFVLTYFFYDPSLIKLFKKRKIEASLSAVLSIFNVTAFSLFLYSILLNSQTRNNLKTIITFEKISNQNQPFGILLVTFTLLWLVTSFFYQKLNKKLIAFFIILTLLVLVPSFNSVSISRYLLIFIPVVSFVSSESFNKTLKEVNSLPKYFQKLKFKGYKIERSLRYSLFFLITVNVLFSSFISVFGFKTINDPFYYPIFHPFSSDATDLDHWKQFEIKMVDYINENISHDELIIVFPYNVYYIENYSRLIYPESSWLYDILMSNKKSDWFSVLKKDYNINYIVIMNSIALEFSSINKVFSEFFNYLTDSNQVLVIQKFEDLREITTKSNLFSALYFIL
ncbi:MAG: hypothetical protein ACTSPQ_09015 [Candidatus Helarchaeota archaeon]